MMSTALIAMFAGTVVSAIDHPHLAKAWVAQSSGDGLKGQTGTESYLYEDGKESSDTCVKAHKWDYGEDTCVKYEIDRGLDSRYSGTFYVKCDAVNCCADGGSGAGPADLKKWDIGMGERIIGDKIKYLGKVDTTGLNGAVVKGADEWTERFPLPFTKDHINYTFYITTNGTDVITHRINYGAPGAEGSILYGNFQVQHNISAFRSVFEPPAECLKANVLACPPSKVKEWNRKYFKHSAAQNGWVL